MEERIYREYGITYEECLEYRQEEFDVEFAESEIKRANGKLNNAEFVAKAPEKLVNAEKEKLLKFTELAEKLKASIASL